MADCRWTGYMAKATTIIHAIKQNEMGADPLRQREAA
jgi:hypothetical protein